MITIYKYEVQKPSMNEFIIKLPQDSKILKYGIQDKKFFIWALVETENVMGDRVFHHVGTGWKLTRYGDHIGTVNDNDYIWHLFEYCTF